MIIIKYSRNEKETNCETTTEFWVAVVTMLLKADCEILEVKTNGGMYQDGTPRNTLESVKS